MERDELNQLWMGVKAHDLRAHNNKALSISGIVKGCYRCRLLKLDDEALLEVLRKKAFRERWAKEPSRG